MWGRRKNNYNRFDFDSIERKNYICIRFCIVCLSTRETKNKRWRIYLPFFSSIFVWCQRDRRVLVDIVVSFGVVELITVCICRLNKEASPSPVCSLVSGRSSWIDGLWCEKFTFRRYFSINCRSCSIPRRRSLPSFFLLFSLLLYVLQLYVVCHRFRSYAVVCDVLFLCFFPRSFGVCVK